METRANYVLIGAFTVASIVAALGFFVWLAKIQIDRQYDRYDLLFTSVAGLSEAADVNMNGVPVGKVTSIGLDDEDPSLVRVRIEVTSGTPVKEDTDARLTPQGVTGLSIVTLSGGSASAPMLTSEEPDGIPEIRADPSLVQQLSEEAPDLLNEAVTLLRDLQDFVSDENQDYVSGILRNVNDASEQLESVIADFSSITETVSGATERISGFTETLEPVALSLETTLKHADDTLMAATAAFDKSQETMDAATQALETADGAVAGIDTVLQDVATEVTDEVTLTLEELRAAIAGIERDADTVLGLFGETATLANARLETLNETLDAVDVAMTEATETMEAVESASISIETLVDGDAAALISEGRLLVGDARVALASVNQVLEDDLPAVVADVRTSADLATATLDRISRDVTGFTQDLEPIPGKLAGALDGATATFANANETLDAVEQTLSSADATLVTVRGVVESADDQIISQFAPVAADLSLAASRVSTSMETIAADVPDLVADLREILNTTGEIVTRIDGVVANSSGPVQDFAVTGLGDLTRFSQEARNLVHRLDRIAAQLERDPARFFLGGQAPDYRR
ncbi:MlaD family protein [Amaricoccus tamworthensis]|uniref:MlaD family protein n=1 Tax=Amaricoccus tamworthensis TaxID=57002 RepID=UPI003C7D0537